MNDNIVIVANGFTQDNVRLQPWRYLYEIARHLQKTVNVIVITEGEDYFHEEIWPEGIKVVRSSCLSVRRQIQLTRLIKKYEPKQLWWSVTPRSVVYWKLLKTIECDKFALVTCPLYDYSQLIRASLAGVPFVELKALWQQRLIPRNIFAKFMSGGCFRKVFTQSQANADVLVSSGIPQDKVVVLRVGIDSADRQPVDPLLLEQEKNRRGFEENIVTLLYFGATRKIRGFDALLKAFSRVSAEADNVRLVVLARGADDKQIAHVNDHLLKLNLSDKVQLIGGWLSREQVWTHIEASNAVVLPFIIVPSDVPIAVLESMARGRPVIASSVDGIPELITGRGLVVDPLDVEEFSNAVLSLVKDQEKCRKLGENALEFMQSYPDWNDIGNQAATEAGLA